MSADTVSITLTRETAYRFTVDFGEGWPQGHNDEPAPLGEGSGPGPKHMLLAGVANCLSASLTFALGKFKQDPGRLQATATATVGRNADNRLRIQQIDVDIRLDKAASELEHLDRVLAQFEAFCTVSQSVQDGIAIHTRVSDNTGNVLKG